MRRLLESSSDRKEDIAAALQHTTGGFVPGLPGLTKLVSLFTKQGKWRKALAIYDVLDCLGLQADLVICNAALGASLPPRGETRTPSAARTHAAIRSDFTG